MGTDGEQPRGEILCDYESGRKGTWWRDSPVAADGRPGRTVAERGVPSMKSIRRMMRRVWTMLNGEDAEGEAIPHPANLFTSCCFAMGTLARIVVPLVGSDLIKSSPFTSCSLSRMLISPSPWKSMVAC